MMKTFKVVEFSKICITTIHLRKYVGKLVCGQHHQGVFMSKGVQEIKNHEWKVNRLREQQHSKVHNKYVLLLW